MKIFIGADHRGFSLKKKLRPFLTSLGCEVIDMGSFSSTKKSDYPLISFKVAQNVARTKGSKGILICWTGIGNTIAADKVRGVRAALCYNKQTALLSRAHNDANVLVMGAKFVRVKDALLMTKAWLKASFESGRHSRRVNQIQSFERKHLKL